MQSIYHLSRESKCIHINVGSADLVAFEVGPSAGGEALLAAEALELRAHAQRVALHTLLLAPHAHNLHVLHVLRCMGGGWGAWISIITIIAIFILNLIIIIITIITTIITKGQP